MVLPVLGGCAEHCTAGSDAKRTIHDGNDTVPRGGAGRVRVWRISIGEVMFISGSFRKSLPGLPHVFTCENIQSHPVFNFRPFFHDESPLN